MNVMTIETPDPIVFKKATALLKKLNVKISVVEQDSKEAISKAKNDEDFDRACSLALTHEEAKAESIRRIKRHFNENGENIYLLNKSK